MSEPTWTTKPIVHPEPRNFEHTATVEGLVVKVTEDGGWTRWVIDGFVQDIPCFAMGPASKRPVEDVKASAVDAARRLRAAGWRGEQTKPERIPWAGFLAGFMGNLFNPGLGVLSEPVRALRSDGTPGVIPAGSEIDAIQAPHPQGVALVAAREHPDGPVTEWLVALPDLRFDDGGFARGATVIPVTAQVDIEDGQEGQFIIGLGPTEDSPWWVVDNSNTARPISVFSFVHRKDAINFRDALNVGDTDTAARIRAAEERRRDEAEARESGEESE